MLRYSKEKEKEGEMIGVDDIIKPSEAGRLHWTYQRGTTCERVWGLFPLDR